MVDKARVFGGVVRAGLAMGSITHLAMWVRQGGATRSLGIRLTYSAEGKSEWHGTLTDDKGGNIERTGETFDGVLALLVTAIGGR